MIDFRNKYTALDTQEFLSGDFKLTPIRYKDRYKIMQWRNEQMYHLRQAEPLTREKQDAYFKNVVAKLFNKEQPSQILFSFLKNDECIGYGGLVHINWVDHNAEISFIMKTELEKENFEKYWLIYLRMIEEVGFNSLNFQKLYVYAFDLRPHLYQALEKADYFLDARLDNHCFYKGEFKDVVVYSKLKS